MKKLLLFLAIFDFSLLSITPLSCSSIGNLADPALLEEGFWISDCRFSNVRLGISGDFLWLKRLRPSSESEGLKISHSELTWSLAACDLGCNIKERFDLHLLVGPVSSIDLRWRQRGVVYEACGESGIFWGASSKLVLLEIEDTTLGIDFHGGGVEWIQGPLIQNGVPTSSSFSSRLYFWQLATGLSQNMGPLRPYLGVATNHLVYLLREHNLENLRLRDLLAIGVFEGCSLSLGSCIFLNLEARQLFESGLSLSGELRF